jgi:hypothetical protein
MADRFIGNRCIHSPYPATRPLPCIHRRGAERLNRQATAVRTTDAYPSKLQQARSIHAAGNETLKPVVASIGSQYNTVGRFRSPRTTEIGWSAMLAWERDTAPGVAGPEGKRRA